LLNDSVQGRFGHSFRSGTLSVDRSKMTPKFATLEIDETTAFGLRLMRSFLKLRDRQHHEELIELAERLAEEEQRYPAEPDV